MKKPTVPHETLVILQQQLDSFPARSAHRRKLVEETATLYGVSVSTVRRLLRNHHKPHVAFRGDYNKSRVISPAEMKQYCELIAALKLRTKNKKRHLATQACIDILENHGVTTFDGLIKAPEGLLKLSTVNRHLNRLGLNVLALAIEPATVSFQATHSNECWQFDFSPSQMKKLPQDDSKRKTQKQPKLMLASVVDDRSGVCYQKYFHVYGEDTLTALRFLFEAMSPKSNKNFPFQGIPKLIYTDNASFGKSLLFKRVLKKKLKIEIKRHMPKDSDGRRTTSRSKGKVERSFRSVKDDLEPLYNFHKPQSLEEANRFLQVYLDNYNNKPHRTENHSRIDDWVKNLPSEGFQQMCSWERFCSFAREPETRKVDSKGCVSVDGVQFQVDYNMAGQEVTLLWGVFDNELFVECNTEKSGPFYPSKGPIELGNYRKPRKSDIEKRADRIEEIAKNISIPRSALEGHSRSTKDLLKSSKITKIEVPRSIPFNDPDSFGSKHFKNRVEAKEAIANDLGRPLGRLTIEQLQAIDNILNASLEKKTVLDQVRSYFTLTIHNRKGDG